MEGLIEQLVPDIQELFKNTLDYSDTVVKEIYDIYPDIHYPLVKKQEKDKETNILIGQENTINANIASIQKEIENSDNARFFDETERVTNLTYQFTINAEQSATKTAIQNVREMANIIDKYLKGPRYRCLRRIGALMIVPTSGDDNVMQGRLRYNCHLERDTNTIYRRY